MAYLRRGRPKTTDTARCSWELLRRWDPSRPMGSRASCGSTCCAPGVPVIGPPPAQAHAGLPDGQWRGPSARDRRSPSSSLDLIHGRVRPCRHRGAPHCCAALAGRCETMSEFHRHVEDYLTLRRSLGYKLRGPTATCFLSSPTTSRPPTRRRSPRSMAVSFAQLPKGVQPIHWAQRLTMVRGFARYLGDHRRDDRGPASRCLRRPLPTPDAVSVGRGRSPRTHGGCGHSSSRP